MLWAISLSVRRSAVSGRRILMFVGRVFRTLAPLLSVALLVVTERSLFADILAGDYATGRVLRYTDNGAPTAGGIALNSAGLDGTAGVAVGPDGNIYVSSQNTGQVLFYDGQ